MANGPLLVTYAFYLLRVGGGIETRPTSMCSESCEFSKDGGCDDGGFGSDFDICPFGTDCEVWLPSKNDLSKKILGCRV